jgi:FkbM family methyltransferase
MKRYIIVDDPVAKAVSLLTAWRRFGNPAGFWLARRLKSSGLVQLEDRQSGVRCTCTKPSVPAFAEVWHRRDYDVPRMQIRPNDVVIDIGANQGVFTCYAAYHGAQVYAFEPFPQSFETLQENVRSNGFEKNVTARPWAIGGKNGTANLTYTDTYGGVMNSINLTFCQNKKLDMQKQIAVPCYTLSQTIEDLKIGTIRLCKIDCEGSELDILKQVTKKELGKIDSLTIEYHPDAYDLQELVGLMLSWGTHQISFADEIGPLLKMAGQRSWGFGTERFILRAVSNQALRRRENLEEAPN